MKHQMFARKPVTRNARAIGEACTTVARRLSPRPESLEARRLLTHVAGHDPVIELRFEEAVGATTVTDSAAAGGTLTGDFAGEVLPEIRDANPSPAGGRYVHFEGDGRFDGEGGRIDMSALLSPVLGDTSSLAFYIRTTQVGAAATWEAPGVTGAEQAGSTDDIFWGNLDPEGRARIQTGLSPISASTPVNDDTWYHVTQTRNAVTGRARTYVNGVFVSEAFTDPGVISAEFRAIGATTDLQGDINNVTGYNYLNGDLDQVEAFNRELSPQEVARFYAAAAPGVPASPAPATATAEHATQVTIGFADVANEAGYAILRSTSAGGPFVDVGAAAPGQTSFVDRSAQPGSQYFYQVVAYNQAGGSAPAAVGVTTRARSASPVIVYDFNEGTGERVEDTSPENVDNDGTLTGDVLPTFQTDDPSPAGGSYLHFEGDGVYKGAGSRVDADELLNPTLGATASLGFYVRTTQVGRGGTWDAPGVTGVEQNGGQAHIYWGNLDPEGRMRVQADDGALSASTPVNTGEWFHVLHTRDAATGQVRTYVNGVFVSDAVSRAGLILSEFRTIGATTDVLTDMATVEGYNHFNGDLDQVEVFERVLTPQEAARLYGPPAAGVPAAPAPLTAVANNPSRVTLTFTDVAGEAGYSVLRSTSAGGPFTELATLNPDQTTFVDQSVLPSTQYFYRVVAFNRAGDSAPAAVSVTTPAPSFNPVIVYTFNEGAGGAVANTGSGGASYAGTLVGETTETGELLPTFQTANPSPAGGSYLRFVAEPAPEGSPTFQNFGGRVDAAELLTPVLGDSATVSFFIRTTQVGHADTWQAPGVTGAERAGSVNDIFWGSLGPDGSARIQTGLSPISSSGPINNGQWVRVTQTRESTTGRARTYVNGVLVSEAFTDPGVITALFRSIGAVTDVNNANSAVTGYNYLDGDLDQIEIFDRALGPEEVAQYYGTTQPSVRVTQVFVNGPTLTTGAAAFKAAAGVDATFGYAVPGGAVQTTPLSWVGGINSVSIRFDSNVAAALGQGDLVINGSAGAVPTTGFTYDAATRTGTWTFAAVTRDKLRFVLDDAGVPTLDGDWTNPTEAFPGVGGDAYPSGDGSAGGDFNFRVNVLHGDVSGDGQVNATDVAEIKRRLTRRPNDGVTDPLRMYTIFSDITGDGVINANDLAQVKARLTQRINTLPNPATAILFA